MTCTSQCLNEYQIFINNSDPIIGIIVKLQVQVQVRSRSRSMSRSRSRSRSIFQSKTNSKLKTTKLF